MQLGSSVREIVNMVTIAVVDVQAKQGEEEVIQKKRLFNRTRKTVKA